jgi:hypothetical protein
MTPTELRALIDERAAKDGDFAAMVDARLDRLIADALPPEVIPNSYLITMRGIRRVLGPHEGRVFVEALRAFAAMPATMPEAHSAYDALWWLAELLPDLDTGGDGIDVGDAETRAALRGLAAISPVLLPDGPQVTIAHCEALEAASSVVVPVSVDAVSTALNIGGK